MSLLKNKIENHLKQNDEMLENQAGFTAGARVEDNLVILNYLKQEAVKRKDKLIITGIDFSKAYDSIKRHKIIEVLKEYKIHESIINSIAEIYKNDRVKLQLGNQKPIQEIEVTSGIRQGCTISARLFKLMLNRGNLFWSLERLSHLVSTSKLVLGGKLHSGLNLEWRLIDARRAGFPFPTTMSLLDVDDGSEGSATL